MTIEGISRSEIIVTIKNRQLKIDGEIILKEGRYYFCANETSIHRWLKPSGVFIDEKERNSLMHKIVDFSKDKNIQVVFDQI